MSSSVLTRRANAGTQGDYQTSLERRLRGSDSTTNQQRVVVVCPYQQFNAFFETIIPKDITPKAAVECIAHSNSNRPPYINVEEREEKKPLPSYIIDFQHIISQMPSTQQYIQKAFGLIISHMGIYSRDKEINKQLQKELKKRDRSPIEIVLNFFHIQKEKINQRLLEIVAQDTTTDRVHDIIAFSGYKEWRDKKKNSIYNAAKRICRAVISTS